MQITLIHNGFHGRTHLRFHTNNTVDSMGERKAAEVSPAVAKRLNRAVCGNHDCRCGESVAYEGRPSVWGINHVYVHPHPYTGRWFVNLPPTGMIKGNYPQSS